MTGLHRFDPETGVELSREKHYLDDGSSKRAPVDDDLPDSHYGDAPTGFLSNGELVSSRVALLNYFRRCHERHHDAPDDGLYRAVALALRRLKAGSDAWDVWIWLALYERLTRQGVDVGWMLAHADPRCPRCAGPLVWEETRRGHQPRCAVDCQGTRSREYLDPAIRDRIHDAYTAAFPGDAPEQITVI